MRGCIIGKAAAGGHYLLGDFGKIRDFGHYRFRHAGTILNPQNVHELLMSALANGYFPTRPQLTKLKKAESEFVPYEFELTVLDGKISYEEAALEIAAF